MKYRLPKWFTDKWLPALESGKYEQTTEALRRVITIDDEYEDISVEENAYCCMGVAGLVCGIPNNELNGDYLLTTNTKGYRIPEELLYNESLHATGTEIQLAIKLANLNDILGSTFKEIAEWVRKNCEIYEDGETI